MRAPILGAALALLLAVSAGMAPSAQAQTARAVPASRGEITLSFAPVVQRVSPAVVNVYTRATVSQRQSLSPLFEDPFFKRFFGDLVPNLPERRRQANSLGSGVIVSSDGLVVTNAHVIKGAEEITVVLSDRRELQAELLLLDEKTDLAVLKVAAGKPLPTVTMGNSDDLLVGDLVLAIGNPFGVGQTVTMGIVSAQARTISGITDYSFFIQTDAAINPGNSGGALVSADGRLVGINTAIYSNTRGRDAGSVGIGFAVPANMVKSVLRAVDSGTVVRPWLGARAQSVDSDLAGGLGLERPVGALVNEVYPGGPADRAGVRTGDVILSVAGKEVENLEALRYRIATREPGEAVEAQVLRDGDRLDLAIEMMAPLADPPARITDIQARGPFQGVRVGNLSPAFALDQGFDEMQQGVIVLGTARGSPADQLGLRRGDQIVAVNGQPIDRVADLDRLLSRGAGQWEIAIRRDGRVLTTRVRG